MNVETANKLVKLRKSFGLSQEDLSEKIGVSRQAISKWERAESSPDTDNLIALSKIYKVSIDALLDHDVEVTLKEVEKSREDKDLKKRQEVFGIIAFMTVLIVFFILGFFYGRWIPFMFMVVPIFYFIPYLRKK